MVTKMTTETQPTLKNPIDKTWWTLFIINVMVWGLFIILRYLK